jgi:ribosomal-protein-alanine N-acetyltransferase
MGREMILETARLILRHQVLEDLDALWALYQDPEVIRYIPDAPPSREEAKLELEWHQHGHPKHPELGLWATIHKDSGLFIGRCGLLPWTLDGQFEVEVAYLLAKAYWGQGLGTEAAQAILTYGFEHLRLPRLVCLIEPGNTASVRVAEKIGMTLEKVAADDKGPFLVYSINRKK